MISPAIVGHNRRVARLCVAIGTKLGASRSELGSLRQCGLWHDVGKLGIPMSLLLKAGALSADEWIVVRRHPELGLSMLERAGFDRAVLLAVLCHHERMDGSGYPYGLAGYSIPLQARVVAVADTYDALISDRPYRPARGLREAWRVMQEEVTHAHLDARIVAALEAVLTRDQWPGYARRSANCAPTILGAALAIRPSDRRAASSALVSRPLEEGLVSEALVHRQVG